MRSSLAVVFSLLTAGAFAAAACSSSDPAGPTQTPDASTIDGAVPDQTSPPGPSDSGPSDGASTDGPVDDGPFCKSAAAAGAAFCADFEQATEIDTGWTDVATSGGATLTLETTIAKQTKSALAKFVSAGSGNGTAAFAAVATASGGAKSKMALEFDGRFSFPNGAPTSNSLFLTIALRTGTGPSGHYFIDLERGAGGWHLLATGTSEEPFLAFGDDMWHHFRLSYDGSGGQGEIRFFVDSSGVATILRPKGPPPGGAPATFDNVLIEHLGVDTETSVSFYIDNVIVTFP